MEPVELPNHTSEGHIKETIRLLLVDDREDHYIVTRRLLKGMRRASYILEWVDNYAAGLQAIEQNQYDVYLIDYHLGPHDGVDLIRQARSMGCRAPMIIFTASDSGSSDLLALNAGATDYLHKSHLDSVLLERTIHYAIQHTQQLEALRQSEHFTQTIISSAGEGLIVYDRNLSCTIWNQFMEELTGVPASQVIGSLQSDLFRDLYCTEPEPLLRRVLSGETIHLPDSHFHIPATGRQGWASSNFRPLVSTTGQVTGVVVTFHDNTERKHAEEALRASEERLRLALDAAVIGTVDWHIPTNQVDYDGHFERLLQLDQSAAINTFEALLSMVHPDDQVQLQDTLLQASIEGAHYEAEFRLRPQNGELRWLAVQGEVHLDEHGRPVRMPGVVQDITERKLVEEERLELLRREQEARTAAEEANALKLRFLAMVSHELRTPLTSIKGFTSTLMAPDIGWDADQYRDFIAIIDEEADKLSDLIEQLMDISRLQAGALHINLQPCDLASIVQGAVAQVSALTQHHRLEQEIHPDLPHVLADRRRIEQVIVNLIENAVKYSPPGTTIHLKVYPVNDQTIQVDVVDEGEGIAPDQRQRVFEAFHQVPKGLKPVKGAGLGLAICKGLVEAHGGKIWIEPRDGPGTQISFVLNFA